MVVEDDDLIRRLLSRALRGWGCLVRAAESGAQGIEAARTWSPALILTDLGLGDMRAEELVEQLRVVCPTAKLIIVSGTIPSAALAASADEFVQKPFDTLQLIDSVKDQIGRGGTRAALDLR